LKLFLEASLTPLPVLFLPRSREVLLSWPNVTKLTFVDCNLLSFVTFRRRGSHLFVGDARTKEIIDDLRGIHFGRSFWEYFVGMREDEGLEGDGLTIVVGNQEKKGWLLNGMERKPPKLKVRIEVGENAD